METAQIDQNPPENNNSTDTSTVKNSPIRSLLVKKNIAIVLTALVVVFVVVLGVMFYINQKSEEAVIGNPIEEAHSNEEGDGIFSKYLVETPTVVFEVDGTSVEAKLKDGSKSNYIIGYVSEVRVSENIIVIQNRGKTEEIKISNDTKIYYMETQDSEAVEVSIGDIEIDDEVSVNRVDQEEFPSYILVYRKIH